MFNTYLSYSMRHHFPTIAFVMVTITAIASLSVHAQTPNQRMSTSEIVHLVRKPAKPDEILRNIKLAIDLHLLLRDDFYETDNLVQFFGGTEVGWNNSASAKTGSIMGYDAMVQPIRVNGFKVDRFHINFSREVNRTIEATLYIPPVSPGILPKFESAIGVFGPNWVEYVPTGIFHATSEKTKTPQGVRHIKYTFDREVSHGELQMDFASDESLLSIFYRELK